MKCFLVCWAIVFTGLIIPSQGNTGVVDAEKTRINALLEEKTVYPEFYIPVPWALSNTGETSDSENKNQLSMSDSKFYSGIGARKLVTNSEGQISGFNQSSVSTTIEESQLLANLISYRRKGQKDPGFGYSLGCFAENITINRKEYGYFQYDPAGGGTGALVNNDIDIVMARPNLYGALRYNSENGIACLLLSGTVAPISWLSVDQETTVKPITDETGTSSGSEFQEISYSIGLDISLDTGWIIEPAITCRYEYLPMKYSLAFLREDSTGGTFSFVEQEVENNETTIYAELRFRLNKSVWPMLPYFGVRYERIKTDDNAGIEDTENVNYGVLGFEGNF